jgi:hypothetical protein
MRSPGMMGAMMGGGRGGKGAMAAQALSDQMGDLLPGGPDPLADFSTGLPGGSSALRGLGLPSGGAKGSKGGKKKKGGRVTPKANGGGR